MERRPPAESLLRTTAAGIILVQNQLSSISGIPPVTGEISISTSLPFGAVASTS